MKRELWARAVGLTVLMFGYFWYNFKIHSMVARVLL